MKTKSFKKSGLLCLFILAVSFSTFVTISAQDEEMSEAKFEIKNVKVQKGLVIKADIPISEIGPKMGEIYSQLFEYMETNNITPAGPPFTVYYSFDPEGNTVFEAGVPVKDKVKGSGDIAYKEYDEMKVVSTLYVGAYENMMPIYTAMETYLKDNKLESTGSSWEIYLTDPDEVASPDENQTLIYFPIK